MLLAALAWPGGLSTQAKVHAAKALQPHLSNSLGSGELL